MSAKEEYFSVENHKKKLASHNSRTHLSMSKTGTVLDQEKSDFSFEEGKTDEIKEKFEVIGIQMDIHKNGTLYLKELVFYILFENYA